MIIRRHTVQLDGTAFNLGGGVKERNLQIKAGEYATPFWVTLEPGFQVYEVTSLPWRWQGTAETIHVTSSSPSVGTVQVGRDLLSRWHVESPPPPAIEGVELAVYRLDETTSGSVMVSNGIPMLPGEYTKAMSDANKGTIKIGGVERQAYVIGMGRHPDNSYRVAFVQFMCNPDTEPVAEFVLNQVRSSSRTYVAIETLTGFQKELTETELWQPQKSGHPVAIAVPTDPVYLCASNIAGPRLVPLPQLFALGGTSQYGAKQMGQYYQVAKDRFDTYQRGRHLYGVGTTLTKSLANQTPLQYPGPSPWGGTNPRPVGWEGEDPPAYKDMIARRAYPSGITHINSYGAGYSFLCMWSMTGDVKYLKDALCIFRIQTHEQRWFPGSTSIQPWMASNSYVNIDPSGHAAYFLLTADPVGLEFLISPLRQGAWGVNMTTVPRLEQIGDWKRVEADGRMFGHAAYGVHESWMATRPQAESHPLCDEKRFGTYASSTHDWATLLDTVLTKYFDGPTGRPEAKAYATAGNNIGLTVWGRPDPCNNTAPDANTNDLVINSFMQAIVYDGMIRFYEDGPPLPNNRHRLQGSVLQATTTLMRFWNDNSLSTINANFYNWFNGQPCSPITAWSRSKAELTSMFSSIFAYSYYLDPSTTRRNRIYDIVAEATGEGSTTTQITGNNGPYVIEPKQSHESNIHFWTGGSWLVRAGAP